MRATLVTDRAGLHALRDEWRALHVACGAGLFQTFEWQAACWDAVLGDRRLRPVILRIEDAGGLCLLPLQRRVRAGIRQLQWLGMAMTDHCDLLATPGLDPVRLAAAVRAHLPAADIVELSQLPPGARAGLLDPPQPDELCPRLHLPPRPPGRATRQARRQLERLGRLEHRPAHTLAEREAVAAFVAHHKRLSLLRTGRPVVEFDSVLAPMLRAIPALDLPHASTALFLDGAMVAAQVGFVDAGALLYWLPAYDAHVGRASPGRVLLAALAEHAAASGLATLDLLRGQEPYKHAWTDETVPLGALRWAVTRRGRAFLLLRRLLRRRPVLQR